jgi:hypothetical protein
VEDGGSETRVHELRRDQQRQAADILRTEWEGGLGLRKVPADVHTREPLKQYLSFRKKKGTQRKPPLKA